MRKSFLFAIIGLALAVLLGVCGQNIAYWLDDNVKALNPAIYLTVITIVSILLFLAVQIYLFVLKVKGILPTILFFTCLAASTAMMVLVSAFSLFALAMWWG